MRHEPTERVPWVPFSGIHSGKLKGYNAIVVQHEIDHINGIMFYDRINEIDPFAVKDGMLVIE